MTTSPFSTATPASTMKPTAAEMEKVIPVIASAKTPPASPKGIAAKTDAAERLRENFRAAIAPPVGAAVSGYWAMEDEMDPRPLLADLAASGHAVCLPVVQGRGKPLLFRAWRAGDALVPSVLGIPVPPPSAAVITPRLLLVPLLAFDREGFRLGHGAGYYDITIAALRAAGPVTAVGIAHAGQEVAHVPREDHDQQLDAVVTEREAIWIGAKA